MTSAFAGLGRPRPAELSLYVVGSGFGESTVAILPEGEVIVVDACSDGAINLTLELLAELGVTTIDLLVVTHSDLDHVRGLPELIKQQTIAAAWRFPAASDVRVLASKWLRSSPNDVRLRDLHAAMTALDEMATKNACAEASADVREWRPPGSSALVHCLAPSQHDQRRAGRALDTLVRLDRRGVHLAETVEQFLARATRKIGTPPNVLSLAVAIVWQPPKSGPDGTRRILIGGDVERGDGTEWSGWRGVLATLDHLGSRAPIQHVDAIKVAHHGSRNAYDVDAWDDHVRTAPDETWAVIAPFQHGGVRLPDREVLMNLRGRGTRLAVCDASVAGAAATAAGWTPDAAVVDVCDAPLVFFRWSASGECSVARGRRAAAFLP